MGIINRITTKDAHGLARHAEENPHQLYALPGIANWVTKEPDGYWIVRGCNRASRVRYKGHLANAVMEAARVTCAASVRILAPQLLGIGYIA